jgi:integrase
MAEPFTKAGKWYSAFKDRNGRWRYLVLNATSKSDARLQNAELQVREGKIRRGIEPAPREDADATFGDLMNWWLDHRLCKTRSYRQCAGTVRRHILGSRLAKLAPAEITPGKVDDFLSMKEGEISAASVNHLRAYIRRAINAATTAERFHGPNPVTRDVKKRKVPKRKPLYLRPEWVPLILDWVPDHWRGVFATGIYAGLRKGEIFALKKSDVDLDAGLLLVRGSNASDITKGGHEDGIPIAEELRPYLQQAIDSSPSDLVFARPDGGQHPEGADLVSIIRTALRRARIVTGYVHKCRRQGCGYAEEAADGELRRCPQCNMKLWPVGKVVPMRFHDTRHTTASLLMMFGANPAAVQRILRHSDIRVTMDVYGHLAPGYLRTEIDRLSFRPKSEGFTSPVLQGSAEGDFRDPTTAENVSPSSDLTQSGRQDLNLRHSAPKSRPTRSQGYPTVHKVS